MKDITYLQILFGILLVVILTAGYLTSQEMTAPEYERTDVNQDGITDIADWSIVDAKVFPKSTKQ